MYHCKINDSLELRSIETLGSDVLYRVLDFNREHVGRWHPWVKHLHSAADTEKFLKAWESVNANKQGLFNGIWENGRLVGMVNLLHIDWINLWGVMSYWLDERSQGRGIMTTSCRVLIDHAFGSLGLNRITIECAADNEKSRKIPLRLGFLEEGYLRQVEWLDDHFADHVVYGLLVSKSRGRRDAGAGPTA